MRTGRLMNSKNLSLIFSLFLISYFSFPAYSYPSGLEGEVIKVIEVEGLTRMKQEELIDIICFKEGDVIDREALKSGIKRAFKKSIFVDIEAVAEPHDNGIKLKYIVEEIPVVKRINIKGNNRISKRKIKKHFFFKKGKNFQEDLLDKAADGLRYFYSRRGFPDAKVRILVEKDEIQPKVTLDLHIEEGQPLIIKTIKTLPEAEHRIGMSEGDIVDFDHLDERIGKLKKYYKKQKYIKPVFGPYEFKNGELVIPVTPGPRLELVFKGNRVFSSSKLSREAPFLEDEEVTGDLLRETLLRIKRLYHKKGYYHVQVVGGIETEENLKRVTFIIHEGKRVILREIKFEGLNITPGTIKGVIPVQEGKPYDRGLLDDSKDAIIGFYIALGYPYADVIETREVFLENDGELNLIFVIHQGPRVRIEKIDITGNEVVSTDEIKKVLQLNEEDPYNEVDIGDARYRILSLYSRFGYIDAEVDVKRSIDSYMAFVTFEITENEPSIIGKIIIRGNEKTKDKIIRREFVIKEGEPYDYEKIFKTRQRLYKLGLFTDISIGLLETFDFKNPGKGSEEVHKQDILVDLKEGNPGAVEIGLGYGDYEQLRGFFDISYRNIGGYNRQIGFRTELSSIEERFILSFKEPWLFNKRFLPLNVSLTKEKIRSVDIDSRDIRYKIDRTALLVGVDREFSEQLKGNLNYEYSLVETTDVKPGIILSKEDTGTLGISSISPALFYDTRDNPFDPTSGYLKGIVLKFASGIFFSETEFIKTILQGSWYFRIKKGLVLAFSIKSGIAHGFGNTTELPIIERFFLGGRNTVRGYEHDTLGPKGEDDEPTGGNVYVQANSELRISLGRGFGLAAFVDSGNVWKTIEDVKPEMRFTTGLGLRYKTPVGPVRVDYGFKLGRKEGESAGEIHFSLGHAF